MVGAPQSGKSTALCTLITALAANHDPGQVQFYCMDFGGGALSSIRELPHVGAVADRFQPELVGRMVAELALAVRTREAFFRDHGIDSIARYRQLRTTPDAQPFADVFLVVDGWAALRHESATLEETITALAAQGLSYGVHVVLSASRWAEIRPALKDQIGTRVELRLGDPADSELDRRRARERLAFDEAVGLQWALVGRRHGELAQSGPVAPSTSAGLKQELLQRLPFELTAGQREVLEVLSGELAATRPMNRLLQGEVGSGKTIVSVLAMLQMVDAGYQCALLAPTEVLSAQHLRSISDVLGPLAMGGQLGGRDNATRLALLTGSMSAAQKRQVRAEVEVGHHVGHHHPSFGLDDGINV